MANANSTTTSAKQEKTIKNALSILQDQLKAPKTDSFNSVSKSKDYLILQLAREERELFLVMFLDAENCLIHSEILFYGTLTETPVYPREIIKKALLHNAASVIVAHNHPSGSSQPSKADISLTKVLKHALDLVGIKLLDHIIVAENKAYSFTEENTLTKDENRNFKINHINKPIKEISDYADFGTGVGRYIEAFANNEKDTLSSIAYSVTEGAFTSLATVGKLIAYSDVKEINTSDIGWLIVMLAEIGANANVHSHDASYIKHQLDLEKAN